MRGTIYSFEEEEEMLTWMSVFNQSVSVVIHSFGVQRVQMHDWHGTMALMYLPHEVGNRIFCEFVSCFPSLSTSLHSTTRSNVTVIHATYAPIMRPASLIFCHTCHNISVVFANNHTTAN